jgi:hypothetical protein
MIPVNVTQATVVVPRSVWNGVLLFSAWPDGILGRAGGYQGKYYWYGSENGHDVRVTGTLSNPASSGFPSVRNPAPINGIPDPAILYHAGGPVITNPIDNSLIQVIHCENYPSLPDGTPNRSKFWGRLAMVKSTDGGLNWSWMGVFLQTSVRFSDVTMCGPAEIAGGPIVQVGNYIYCFYREVVYRPSDNPPTCIGYVSVARADANGVNGVFTHAASNPPRVVSWLKFDGKDWTLPATGTGVQAGAQLPGLTQAQQPRLDWCDVVYHARARCFLMAWVTFDTGAASAIHLSSSPDGIHWTTRGTPAATDSFTNRYPSLAFLDTVNRSGNGNLNLYYVTTQWPSPGHPDFWATAQLRMRALTVQTGAPPNARGKGRQGGPGAATMR